MNNDKTIIINKRYFNNIEKSVDSLNQFFTSNFQKKDLLKVDEVSDLDQGVKDILDSIDTVDSRWITNPELAADAADKLNESKEDALEFIMDKEEGNDFMSYCDYIGDTGLSNTAKEFLSFKALEQISDNMSSFEKLLNGIYSFELFTKPSQYKKEIETFGQNVPKGECSDVLGGTEYSVFNLKDYVTGLFENEDIELPEDMDIQKEMERVSTFTDLDPNIKIAVNESIQEAAAVNYFTNTKPKNIKYSNGKWQISDQFEKTVDELIAGLRKCESSEDLKSFIESNVKKYSSINDTVAPFILVQGFIKKGNGKFTKYSDSYKSIVSKNNGAKRFENYDIFTTFKSDKEGTLKFISDFCKLKLVNDSKAKISNNTLLTLFNIFDSRIYFDIMYNMIPDKEKKDKGMDEDSFVRKQRAIINNNSRGSNPYQNKNDEIKDTESTSSEINEYAYEMIRSMGDMTITDMSLCESWHDMLHEEIMTLDDGLYNAGIPVSATYDYIDESFYVIDGISNDILMESFSERAKVVGKTVLGGLIGNFGLEAGTYAALRAGLAGLLGIKGVTLLELLVFGKLGMAGGAIVGNLIAKKSRGKSIKAEIVRDTNSIITALSKETDEIDDYIIRDLKKRARNLAETLSFAIKRKDLFKEDDREKLVDLHHAVININTKLDANDKEKNKSIISTFFKAADAVLIMITKIDPKQYVSQNELPLNEKEDDLDSNKTIEPIDDEDTSDETESKESDDVDESEDNDDTDADDESVSESYINIIPDQVFLETKSEYYKMYYGTYYSALIGGIGSMVGINALLFYGFKVLTLSNIIMAAYSIPGVLLGYAISHKILAAKRDKGIKGEIVEDIEDVLNMLSKPADSVEKVKIWKVKGKIVYLYDSLNFAINRKTDDFSVSEKQDLIKLRNATNNLYKKISKDNFEQNKELFKEFFEQCDVVLKMLTGITNDEVKKLTKDFEEKVVKEYAIQEVDDGSIPEYMKTRIKLSDESGNTRRSTVEPVSVPSDDGNVPSNSIDDLAMSIDAKINAGDDNINDIIGREAKKDGTHIVYNVTNNYSYSNSFNKTSNDLSQNKHTDQSVHAEKTTDLSNRNALSRREQSNNKYNSTGSSDSKDEKSVKEFSTGYSVESVFAFLNSEEPLLEASDTKPPKEDSLTKAMDRDRKSLPKQQAAKKAVNKAVGTAKAVTKPVVRTKHWLLGIVDSLVKRKEDKVKAEIIESPSYRTALFKAGRIALKIGLTGVAFTINGYLGAAYLLAQASNVADRQRLRKEVENEFATEMRILDDKIRLADEEDTPESRKAKWEMMRLRGKMQRIVTNQVPGAKVIHPTAVD